MLDIKLISRRRDPIYCSQDSFYILILILDLRPANEVRRFFVTTSLIGWAQA